MAFDERFRYPAREVVKVTDGDTFWLRLDVGFRSLHLTKIRLAGYDTPEKNRGSAFEKSEALVAQRLTAAWLAEALKKGLWVFTEKDPDDFGRWLADPFYMDGEEERHLSDALMQESLAVKWPTRWREVYDASRVAVEEEPVEEEPDRA